jgi:hypothetical protein
VKSSSDGIKQGVFYGPLGIMITQSEKKRYKIKQRKSEKKYSKN